MILPYQEAFLQADDQARSTDCLRSIDGFAQYNEEATAMSEARLNREKQPALSINTSRLLDRVALERSEIVANACMNRERNLSGANSYEADLGLDPLEFLIKVLQRQGEATWLDLCCGTGRALLQAAGAIEKAGLKPRIQLLGVDLVPMFDPIPAGLSLIRLVSASVERWDTEERFDLITCVHGFHFMTVLLNALHVHSRSKLTRHRFLNCSPKSAGV